MAYLPFEYLKEKLFFTGLYKDKEDSAALLELRCYAAGFQALGDEIESILQESFAQTAESDGLDYIENKYDLGFISDNPEERKRGIIAASKIAAGSFTQRSIEAFLSETVGEFEMDASYANSTVGITIKNRGLSSYFIDWIKRILPKIITAELELSITIDGLSWTKIDEKNLTWLEMDNKNYTWADIEIM